MRIAQIAPLAEKVPPEKYGGTERVIYALTEELVKRGHEVTLFASGDSKTSAKLISVIPEALRKTKLNDLYGYNTPTMKNIGLAYSMQDEFDIIHDHTPAFSLPTANLAHVPTVITWHGPYTEEIVNYFKMFPRPSLVSISKSQVESAAGLSFAGTVYNGLNMQNYPFSDTYGDYLLFVGRIDMEKGTHIAIDIAARTGKKIVIAAKLDRQFPHIKEYFEKRIQPRLRHHRELISWIGEVTEEERNELMKNALCLIHPVTWPEPFGLTLIEAAACGCPVVAFGLGAIPEVVVDKRTGFIVSNTKEMVDAVKKVGIIQRTECRRHALENFSAQRMTDGYEEIYKKLINHT